MASRSTIELDLNNPLLFSEEGKKRKAEMSMKFLQLSKKLQQHGFGCPVMREGKKDAECEICEKFLGLINILVQEEFKKKLKLDLKRMVDNGIIDYMVFGPGIQILNK